MRRLTQAGLVVVAALVSGCASGGGPEGAQEGTGGGGGGGGASLPPARSDAGSDADGPPLGAVAADAGLVRATEPVGTVFAVEDNALCGSWPVCPADVFGIHQMVGWLQSASCKAKGGIAAKTGCGACVRRSTCEVFTGRCIAPVTGPTIESARHGPGIQGLDDCRTMAPLFSADAPPYWTICTATVEGPETTSPGEFQQGTRELVCQDY